MDYEKFIKTKIKTTTKSGFEVAAGDLHTSLFPFQRDIVAWALQQGKAAIFADCGLGKTAMEIEFAHHCAVFTGKPSLMVAPLAVADQTVNECVKIFGDDRKVVYSNDGEAAAVITITNYEQFH